MDKNNIDYKKIGEIADSYFSNNHFMKYGSSFSNGLFIANIETEHRSLISICKIDDISDRIILEIEPQVHVSTPFRGQVSEYLSLINTNLDNMYMGIRKNGTVYIHCERSCYGDITELTFEELEDDCVFELLTFADIIEKLANGRLLTTYEIDVDSIIKDRTDKLWKTHIERISEIDFDLPGFDGFE